MQNISVNPADPIHLFVRQIWVFEENDPDAQATLPFFADGHPGLIHQAIGNKLCVQPQNKQMPVTFLYGQTLHPVTLHLTGAYKLIVLQLYPFVLHRLFGLDARALNNDCFDVLTVPSWQQSADRLALHPDTEFALETFGSFLYSLFLDCNQKRDAQVGEALKLILENNARITVSAICNRLHMTERTFERRFAKEVGISPKDFIQITRFQQSLEQLSNKTYDRFTDIVYANGFADQSHFIRVFKAFTGQTPSRFPV